jgi:hypothetical protein
MADNYNVLTGDVSPALIPVRAKNNGGVYTGYIGADAGALVDGANVTVGTTTDAPATTADTTSWSIVALIKGIFAAFLSLFGAAGSSTTKAISVQSPSASATLQNAATGTGNGTDMLVGGLASITVTLTGGVGTFTFTGSEDGTNFVSMAGTQIGAGTPTTFSNYAINGNQVVFQFVVSGFTKFRAAVSAYISGTLTATAHGASNIYFHKGVFSYNPNIAATPQTLFDITTTQAGVTQLGQIFPTTIALTAFPPLKSGQIVTLTNSGNVCGAIFAPDSIWDSVLIDFAAYTTLAATLTIEIGRIATPGAMAQVLATAVLTASSFSTGLITTNPFTGATGHSSVNWRFFDGIVLTSLGQLGQVLVSINGASGSGPSQLILSCHEMAYYYIQIISSTGTLSETLVAITPKG